MGFQKGKLDKVITIKVNHGQFPDTDFVFKFKRTLDEQAAKEQAAFFGLEKDERIEVSNLQFIKTIAALLTEAPKGFDDLTGENLFKEIVAYYESFDDEDEKFIFFNIFTSAWLAYRDSFNTKESVYLRRVEDNGNSDGLL